jgi:XTP/dITP diphosphohydrolase
LLPDFEAIPPFDESAATFAENAAGKALHYSRLTNLAGSSLVFADDSGLAVTALGGRPGVHSARYGGPGVTSAARNAKLINELRDSGASDRSARFICVIAVAIRGQILAVVSASVAGEILEAPRGDSGFGYDPVFFFHGLGKTFAELSPEEKNLDSHRGKAFRKLLRFLNSTAVL